MAMIDYQTLCQAVEHWKQGGTPNAGVAQEVVEEVDSGLVQMDDIAEASEGDAQDEDDAQDEGDDQDAESDEAHGEIESAGDSYDSEDS